MINHLLTLQIYPTVHVGNNHSGNVELHLLTGFKMKRSLWSWSGKTRALSVMCWNTGWFIHICIHLPVHCYSSLCSASQPGLVKWADPWPTWSPASSCHLRVITHSLTGRVMRTLLELRPVTIMALQATASPLDVLTAQPFQLFCSFTHAALTLTQTAPWNGKTVRHYEEDPDKDADTDDLECSWVTRLNVNNEINSDNNKDFNEDRETALTGQGKTTLWQQELRVGETRWSYNIITTLLLFCHECYNIIFVIHGDSLPLATDNHVLKGKLLSLFSSLKSLFILKVIESTQVHLCICIWNIYMMYNIIYKPVNQDILMVGWLIYHLLHAKAFFLHFLCVSIKLRPKHVFKSRTTKWSSKTFYVMFKISYSPVRNTYLLSQSGCVLKDYICAKALEYQRGELLSNREYWKVRDGESTGDLTAAKHKNEKLSFPCFQFSPEC